MLSYRDFEPQITLPGTNGIFSQVKCYCAGYATSTEDEMSLSKRGSV
jgi:hypothetical protein